MDGCVGPISLRCASDSTCSSSNNTIGLSLLTYDATNVVAQYITNWPTLISGNG